MNVVQFLGRTKLMCGRQKGGRREGKVVGGFVAAEGSFIGELFEVSVFLSVSL